RFCLNRAARRAALSLRTYGQRQARHACRPASNRWNSSRTNSGCTNAVYHLACLGGSISCSRDIFERFWKDRLHESADDRQSVAAWQRLLASAVERAPEMKPSPLLINAVPM